MMHSVDVSPLGLHVYIYTSYNSLYATGKCNFFDEAITQLQFYPYDLFWTVYLYCNCLSPVWFFCLLIS